MTSPTAEQVALQGLLLIVAEIQNEVRASHVGQLGEIVGPWLRSLEQIEQLVEGAHTAEMVQLARAAIASTSTSTRQTFFGVVTEFDCDEKYRNRHQYENHGPIIFEQYLNEHTRDRAALEAKARAMTQYGWARVAEITVDIPVTPAAAIPADQAATHA